MFDSGGVPVRTIEGNDSGESGVSLLYPVKVAFSEAKDEIFVLGERTQSLSMNKGNVVCSRNSFL